MVYYHNVLKLNRLHVQHEANKRSTYLSIYIYIYDISYIIIVLSALYGSSNSFNLQETWLLMEFIYYLILLIYVLILVSYNF